MIQHYFVKQDLFGIARGRVERFAPHKAAVLLAEDKIEPFDEKKKLHAEALAGQERDAQKRHDAAEAVLALERTKPEEFHALQVAMREEGRKRQIAERKAEQDAREKRDKLTAAAAAAR